MAANNFKHLTITDVQFLPIVKEYARRIQLVDTITQLGPTDMELKPGIVVLAMVLDSLSGRSPLYRLMNFFDEKDTELLLGEKVPASRFTDYNIGRALDCIFETGTQKIFGQLSQNAVGGFKIQPTGAHYDTTSITVFGDYAMTDKPFEITYGYSKDKRPDLKQFLVEMLCVERNIPLFGATRDGNASDKTLNNELLSHISKHMARHGIEEGAFVYVADSAFVTKENLEKAGTRTKFLSRLPATYKECGRAIVIHSSAHDKRRHKRIDKELKKNKEQLEQIAKKITAEKYFCEADAEAAALKLRRIPKKSDYYLIKTAISKVDTFRRGRPKKGEARTPESIEYRLDITLVEDASKLRDLRQEAGCFVLLSNLNSPEEKESWSPEQLLRLYKNQGGIEQNFGFLKDPVVINSVFLKKNSRIEVLGMILLTALLIWRLIERSMRMYLEKKATTITGWVKRQTKRPTSFMMTTKFYTILVIKSGKIRATCSTP